MLSVPLDLKINRATTRKVCSRHEPVGHPRKRLSACALENIASSHACFAHRSPGVTSATFIDGQEGVQPAFAGPYASCRALKSNVSTNAIVPTYTHHIVRHLVMCHSQLIGN